MLSSLNEILDDIRAGKMIILVDDEDRENEGDLVFSAENITPEAINFMAKFGRGLVCLALTPERIAELELPPMSVENTAHFETAFHVSIGAAKGITTGISAQDRATTIRVAVDPASKPGDLSRPGHVFPLRAQMGGVLVRSGHTEASVDLMRMAGLNPSAVICEVMNDDGTMARMPQLEEFAQAHGLNIYTIADLIRERRKVEQLVERTAEANLPTEFGEFKIYVYTAKTDGAEHIALAKGDVKGRENVLVRVHSECLTGDILHSLRCDCGGQLKQAMKMIGDEGCGVLVYMRQEGRGIGLSNKIKAYNLQDQGRDTVEANLELGFKADHREYGIGAQMLADLGVTSMRLITNNPVKRSGLEGYGLKVVDRIPLIVEPGEHNRHYLDTKREKLGHLLG